MPRLKRHAFHALPRLLELGRLLAHARSSPEAIRRMQEKKLRALVEFACRRVPFYRELYRAAGVDPAAIRSLADLPRLPIVSKRDFLGLPVSQLLASGVTPADCVSSSSSGSSGSPLTAYWLPGERAAMNVSWKRAYLHSGVKPRDRIAAFIGRRQSEHVGRWPERIGFFPRREISNWLQPDRWVDALREWRPQAITGSVMTLRLLAEFVRDQKIAAFRPRVILPTSELLDEPSRRLLADVFACPVIDLYGSEEAGCMAWECPVCRGYHLAADMLIVEVLKDGVPARPGEQGEVVVTNLCSHAMPFIRYRQGDRVTVSPDAPKCGSPFPLIAHIEGRVDDFIVLKNGRQLPPHPFYHCVDPLPGITLWRMIQESAGTMRLELVVGDDFPPEGLQQIRASLTELTKGGLDVEIAMVDNIPLPAGVKFRRVSSRAGTVDARGRR